MDRTKQKGKQMIVHSTRFGQIEVPEDKIISMQRPILGFEKYRRFCLIEIDELRPFLWMQSFEDPNIAFLVVNPLVFFPDYRIEINSAEIGELEVTDVESVETYVVATVPEDPTRMSINLQGPILINSENNLGKQLVLVNSEYRVQHNVLEALNRQQPRRAPREELAAV
jgi:flagellar assembly factor FliW